MVKPQALYDINKSFIDNWQSGPQFFDTIVERPQLPSSQWHNWLGFKLASRIGVAPCPIMLGKGIALASRLGLDVFTYKSIRSRAHPGNPMPNIVFIDCDRQLQHEDLIKPILQVPDAPPLAEQIAISNSFGNGSLTPEQSITDIAFAKQALQPGQVLLVSIYGEADENQTQLEDFAYIASFAKEAGADVIEANLSCPNIHAGRGLIYEDPEYVYAVSAVLVKAIAPTPVLLKIGLFHDIQQLQHVLTAAARAGVAGISAINSLSMQVVNTQHQPAFGATRPVSGVSGFPIRQLALHFVQTVAEINHQQQLGLSIVGIGGVTEPKHFTELHAVGADIALTAAGFMWNPYLGIEYQRSIVNGT